MRCQGEALAPGRSRRTVAGPIPGTFSRSSTVANGPCAARHSTMRRASAGPIPGSVASSSAVARFTSTGPDRAPVEAAARLGERSQSATEADDWEGSRVDTGPCPASRGRFASPLLPVPCPLSPPPASARYGPASRSSAGPTPGTASKSAIDPKRPVAPPPLHDPLRQRRADFRQPVQLVRARGVRINALPWGQRRAPRSARSTESATCAASSAGRRLHRRRPGERRVHGLGPYAPRRRAARQQQRGHAQRQPFLRRRGHHRPSAGVSA